MAHPDVRSAPWIHRAALALLIGAALGSPAARADAGMERLAAPADLGASLRLHLGPLSRRSIEVGTLLSAEPGHERLYAFVDLQDRLPLPVRRVLRHVDGGITVERGSASVTPDLRSGSRASLGSMLRWQVRGGTQMAVKLRAGRIGLQLTTPLTF